MKQIESERVVNIAELEQMIGYARADVAFLKKALEKDNKEGAMLLVERLDLKLHEMEVFNFVIERRVIEMEE